MRWSAALVLLSLAACTPRGAQREVIGATGALTGVTSLVAGSSHACAIERGRVLCWGSNPADKLSVSASSLFRAALGSKLAPWVSIPKPVIGLERAGTIVQLGASSDFTCALGQAGDVYCWGYNGYGQLGIGDLHRHRRPVRVLGVRASAIHVGFRHACALAHDRSTGWCWGSGDFPDGRQYKSAPIEIPALADVDQLTSNCWLRDGEVRCWGDNSLGQIGNGEGGCVYEEPFGPPSSCKYVDRPTAPLGLPAIVQIAGRESNSYALDRDGGVWQWGDGVHHPRRITELPPVVQISAGNSHACARTEQGALYCWGSNAFAQLGFVDADSGTVEYTTPLRVEGLPAIRDVAAGYTSTCAIAGEHEHTQAWCWGSGSDGQLGDGELGRQRAPTQVSAPR